MLIACPQCQSRYAIPDGDVRPEGRLVRCTRCRAEWILTPDGTVEPQEAAPALLAGDIEMRAAAPEPAFAGTATEEPASEPATGADEPRTASVALPDRPPGGSRLRARKPKVKPRRGPALRLAGLAAGLAALVLIVQARESVVRAAPGAASLFALLHLPVNLRGIAIDALATHGAEEEGTPVLVAEGVLHSLAREPRPLAPLRFSIRDEAGTEIYAWTAPSPGETLEPGARMPFKSRLASPPAEGRTLSVRFARPDDAVAGSH